MRYLMLMLTLATMSCQDTNFPKVYLLDELRILGVQLDTPEIADPGAAVNVTATPLIADYNGGGRALSLTIIGCIDPGVSLGADPTCDSQLDRQVLSATSVITPTGGSSFYDAPNYVGPVNSAYVLSIPTGTLLQRSAIEQFNGIAYLLEFILTTGNLEVRAFKRLIVSTKTLNQNPPSPSILVNAVAPAALPSSTAELSISVAANIEEDYALKSSLGVTSTVNEKATLSWFISGGSLDYDKVDPETPVNWTPPSTIPAGQNVVSIAILRDNRGGLSFVKTEF